jgi:hypothetical protein
MLDMQTLTILDKIAEQYWSFSKRTPDLEHLWGQTDVIIFYELRNAFFSLITGEPNFNKFYERFDAPGVRTGKPVAWGPRFLPDMMNDEIWNFDKRSLNDRVKTIKKLYKECLKLEKNHKK